jgi:hypothetical protein
MAFLKWYTFLMKGVPKRKKERCVWVIDESKCFTIDEVERLRIYCENLKREGLKKQKFVGKKMSIDSNDIEVFIQKHKIQN